MISDAYDSGIAYMDERIGGFLDHVRALGLEPSTLVVLTSDHGEGLGEHGEYRHRTLYDEILRVPLIVSGPGVPAGRLVDRQVRQVDVTPTILDLVGLPPQGTGAGKSLRSLMEDPGAPFEEMAWSYAPTNYEGLSLRIGNRQKYIVNDAAFEPLRGRARLFDLTRDPREGDAGDTAPEHLSAAAQDMLLRHWHGLDVFIENSDTSTLRVGVAGHLSLSRMRSAVFGEARARFEGEPAQITVPPGSSWSGVWLGPDPLTLEGTWTEPTRGPEDGFTLRAHPATLHEARTLGWSNGGWGPVSESATPSAVVRVEPRGGQGGASGGAFIDDPAVLDQLRALGYVR